MLGFRFASDSEPLQKRCLENLPTSSTDSMNEALEAPSTSAFSSRLFEKLSDDLTLCHALSILEQPLSFTRLFCKPLQGSEV
jgi:hypothetical protein